MQYECEKALGLSSMLDPREPSLCQAVEAVQSKGNCQEQDALHTSFNTAVLFQVA